MPGTSRFAALLRGVNVGGVPMPMAAVKGALEGAGLSAVSTVLASGNVLADSTGETGTDRAVVERTLAERFGYEGFAVVVPLEELARVVAAAPFPPREGFTANVVFALEAAALDDVASAATTGHDDRVHLSCGVAHWEVRKGETTTSPVGRALARRALARVTTVRTVRTLERLLR